MTEKTDTLTLDLNVFAEDGEVADTVQADVSKEGVQDIVDHAVQLVEAFRNDQDIRPMLDELGEALTIHDVIAADPDTQPLSEEPGNDDDDNDPASPTPS